MHVTITVDAAALARIIAALDDLGRPAPDLVRLIGDAVARDGVMRRIINYPPPKSVPQPFVSAKQRRWFFAALRSGAISVPYTRSYRLQRGWQPFAIANGAEVKNDTPYAARVMGTKGEQASYFSGKGWLSIDQVARETEAEDAEALAAAAASLWIAGRGLG